MGVIYKITNLINDKVYIGMTIYTSRNRWSEHIKESKNQLSPGYNYLLHKAIRKYGEENFKIEDVEVTIDEQLACREIYWIGELNSILPNGYNMVLSRKKVYKYTTSGELIKVFNSIEDAANSVGVDRSTISRCCSGQNGKQSSKGFIWSFNLIDIPIDKKIKLYKEPILQLDLSGTIILEHVSSAEAAKAIGIKSSAHISECCRGKRKTAYGFKWQFKNDKLAQAATK